jgi:16S rRNA (guanine966-N2)-methyltransferase
VRIIAGEWRGRPLVTPSGMATRPTSDRAREGIFSMLASRLGSFEGLRVADLFAGTGALGLEALSRGAAHCTFVEKDRAAVEAINGSLARFLAASRATVRTTLAQHAPAPAQPCDLIFLDPPYAEEELLSATLARVATPEWLANGGYISVEAGHPLDISIDGYAIAGHRRFGKACITLIGG